MFASSTGIVLHPEFESEYNLGWSKIKTTPKIDWSIFLYIFLIQTMYSKRI